MKKDLKIELASVDTHKFQQAQRLQLPDKDFPFVDLKLDYAFKKLFSEKEMLLGLLHELLPELYIEEINEIKTSSSEEILKEVEEAAKNGIEYDQQEVINRLTDRKSIMDIVCTTTSGEKVMIEMQNEDELKEFSDRSLYYATLEVQEQMTRGKKKYEVQPIYSINFLNFKMLSNNKCVSRFSLRDDETKESYEHNKLHFTYIELPKFKKEAEECASLLDKIIFTIKNSRDLKEMPKSFESDDYMKKMFKFATYENYKEEQRKLYEDFMYTVDQYFRIIQHRYEQGEAKGTLEKAIAVAKNMLAAGLDINLVVSCTGLTEEEVKALQQN